MTEGVSSSSWQAHGTVAHSASFAGSLSRQMAQLRHDEQSSPATSRETSDGCARTVMVRDGDPFGLASDDTELDEACDNLPSLPESAGEAVRPQRLRGMTSSTRFSEGILPDVAIPPGPRAGELAAAGPEVIPGTQKTGPCESCDRPVITQIQA